MWLFGGGGNDSVGGTYRNLNDLWRFDGTNWTWVSGSSTPLQTTVVGVQGVASQVSEIGARYAPMLQIDSYGMPWIFGGYVAGVGYYSDLWMINP